MIRRLCSYFGSLSIRNSNSIIHEADVTRALTDLVNDLDPRTP